MPSSASARGPATSRLTEISTPSNTPASVPITPIATPCVRKIASTLRGAAPSVRRMAMSERLSFTTMTSVETILKAATPTTSSRMRNSADFVSWIERKKFACLRVQSSM